MYGAQTFKGADRTKGRSFGCPIPWLAIRAHLRDGLPVRPVDQAAGLDHEIARIVREGPAYLHRHDR